MGGGVAGAAARDLPHSPQNLKSGGFSVPHTGQTGASFVPHWPQNFMPGGLSNWHCRHLMAGTWNKFTTRLRRDAGHHRVDYAMVDQDLKELRRLLRDAVESSRMYVRDIEAAMGVGHGNLERLLNGTLELRVRHLVAFARLLKIPPA